MVPELLAMVRLILFVFDRKLMEFARPISRIWYLFGGGWAGWSSLVLHNHGNCHLLGHILSWRNDVLDASERPCDGIS